MNVYLPPEAPVSEVRRSGMAPGLRLGLAAAFAAGMFLSFAVAAKLITYIPPLGLLSRETALAFFSGLSVLIALGAAAPWWIPVAYAYPRRAFVAGALIAAPQALLRFALLADQMTSAVVTATVIIETVGLVAVSAVGAHIAARRLSANNSSKPTPLRGAA